MRQYIISSARAQRPLTGIFGATISSLAITLWSCGSVQAPLAIRMYNPKTQQTLHCTARSESPEYAAALAKTVEACAQQLEARGFVRDN